MSTSATPDPERELALVNKVTFMFLRVVNDEEAFNNALNRYLPALLLKVESLNSAVRTEVLQFTSKLKTFLAPQSIVCPVGALVDQMLKTQSQILKLLDSTFIRHSLPRIGTSERAALFNRLFLAVARETNQVTAAVYFNFLLRVLPDVKFSTADFEQDLALRKELEITDQEAHIMARWLGIVLLLKMPVASQLTEEFVVASNRLDRMDLAFLKPWDKDMTEPFIMISRLKSDVVRVLHSSIFTDKERFLPGIFAAASTDGRVSEAGIEMLKKTNVDYDDVELVKNLWRAHEQFDAPVRTRILQILLKSDSSTTMDQEIMAAVCKNLATRDTVSKDISPAQSQLDAQRLDTNQKELALLSSLEKSRLYAALFEYIKFAANVGPTKGEFRIGEALIACLQQFLEVQNETGSRSIEQARLRGFVFEVIGLLSKSRWHDLDHRMKLVYWLFVSLSNEGDKEVALTIEGALSMYSLSFQPAEMTPEVTSRLLKILEQVVDLVSWKSAKNPRPVLHVAVKWANRCVPFDAIPARWLDILAIAVPGDSVDAQEEGEKGLDPFLAFTYAGVEPREGVLPDWKQLVDFFFPRNISHADALDPENNRLVGDQIKAFPRAINFCVEIMLLDALGADAPMVEGWRENLKSLLKTNVKARSKVWEYLGREENRKHIDLLAWISINSALSGKTDDAISEHLLREALVIAKVMPQAALAGCVAKVELDHVRRVMASKRQETRHLGGQILAILLANMHASDHLLQDVYAWVQGLLNGTVSVSDVSLAAVLEFWGTWLARRVLNGQTLCSEVYSPAGRLPEAPSSADDPLMLDALFESLAALWTVGLCLPDNSDNLEKIIKSLVAHARQGKQTAITCLGRLALSLSWEAGEAQAQIITPSQGPVQRIITELFGLYELKQVEIHFIIGEALATATAGWDSECVKLLVDFNTVVPHQPAATLDRSPLLAAALSKLIKDTKQTKPALLKASGVWMFCLVQYCGHMALVHERLRDAQGAFMRLLSARDDIVQETAARGLSLVYEKGDAESQKQLVDDIIGAFTGTGQHLKVDEDTELFDPGALPTGDGQSITSYKDIVNLASEVGDQRLIYKFMSLAANATMWSTRSAFGRFGLSRILVDTEIDPKLYPKLFRYRFDPNPNVQRSMNSIWKALVPEPAATIDKHFDAMMEDLLTSVLGREWRMREASCSALAELIQGRRYRQYHKYYPRLWMVALKVIDDVKGSVRKAALTLCMTLANTLVRTLEAAPQADIGSGKADADKEADVEGMIKKALEFLLSPQGTESSVKEVRSFSTMALLSICQKGGIYLRKYTVVIVPHLLGLLSTLEPEIISYAYQRVSTDTKEKLDKHRAQHANTSPLTQAVENCLRFADAEAIAELIPAMETTIRSAVGMPTKIGCARVLGTIFTHHANEVRGFVSKLLTLLLKQMLDRNDQVSKCYAQAAAYGLRVGTPTAKKKFCTKVTDYYFAAPDASQRRSVGDAVLALSKTSPDEFTNVETFLLPLVFLAKHDVDSYTSTEFEAVWSQHAGTDRAVVRYVVEIVALADRALETNMWDLHHTAAFTVGAMIRALTRSADSTGGEISAANTMAVWPVFDRVLALKSFVGKEKVLEALPLFANKTKSIWKSNNSSSSSHTNNISDRLVKVVIREAKRNNDTYRPGALQVLWKFAQVSAINIFDDIVTIVSPLLTQPDADNTDTMDVDGRGLELLGAALDALGRGYHRESLVSDPGLVIKTILDIAKPVLLSESLAAVRRAVWYQVVRDIAGDLAPLPPGKKLGMVEVVGLLKGLDMEQCEVGTESERRMRVAAVAAVVSAAVKGETFEVIADDRVSLQAMVASAAERERNLTVAALWKAVFKDLE